MEGVGGRGSSTRNKGALENVTNVDANIRGELVRDELLAKKKNNNKKASGREGERRCRKNL
jgi:hypothetical protein